MFNSIPPGLLQQMLAARAGGAQPGIQQLGAPPMNPMAGPAQPGTFTPMPFEGGLGGMPKRGPQFMPRGLGSGMGFGNFNLRPFVPGDQRVKAY